MNKNITIIIIIINNKRWITYELKEDSLTSGEFT